MKQRYSAQYGTACVVVDRENPPNANELITRCREVGATFYEDGPDDECFVVDTARGVGPELYTSNALKRSAMFVCKTCGGMQEVPDEEGAEYIDGKPTTRIWKPCPDCLEEDD